MLNFSGIENVEMCPHCGNPLVTRTNSKTGTKFKGCSNYPQCSYIQRSDSEWDGWPGYPGDDDDYESVDWDDHDQ